ncbi:HPt (histidine-containing phosphotransfer) domain-containing protein [Bradyrhizobium sp. GM2.4]
MIKAGQTMFEVTVAPAQTVLDAEPAREPGAYQALVREIGEDGACEVRDVFWSETCARLQSFRTLSLAQHHGRIAREAHSLKGAAGTFGYVRLAVLALRLEKDRGEARRRRILRPPGPDGRRLRCRARAGAGGLTRSLETLQPLTRACPPYFYGLGFSQMANHRQR